MISHLQTAIDRSFESASAFTRSLFEERWTAEQVEVFINRVRNITIATTSSSGHPHAAVVIAVCVSGEIFFTVHPKSALSRNLRASDRIAFTANDGVHAVMGRGSAQFVSAALDDPPLIAKLAAATSSGSFTPEGWDGNVYRIEVDRIFAN